MATDNYSLSDFSVSDYSGISNYYVQKLGKEFQRLHTREECNTLMNRLNNKIADNAANGLNLYGSAVQSIYVDLVHLFADEVGASLHYLYKAIGEDEQNGRFAYGPAAQKTYNILVNIFKECSDSSDLSVFPEQINESNKEDVLKKLEVLNEISSAFPDRLNKSNRDAFDKKLNALSQGMKSQEEIDELFLEELQEIYYNEKNGYKGGGDYVRRLVIRRLREISPEFVCDRNDEGYVYVTEGKHKGKKKLRDDIDSIPTRLLILKQFIKQFGWCDGLVGDDDHGRGFKCAKIKEIIEENYAGNWQRTAEEITEDIFVELSNAQNRKMLSIAEDMEEGKFGDNGRTREDLYVFAIAFQMKWHEKAIGDDDIRKNLFFDYYSENLVYDLNRKGNRKGQGKWEANIPGYGINYKNFVEICYLYSIEKEVPETAEMEKAYNSVALYRFQRAKSMIKSCTDSKEKKSQFDFYDEKYSRYYAESFKNELLGKDEDDAVSYILKNYVCKYDRIENQENLIEEDGKDYEKIKKILCALERYKTLKVQPDGCTWEYTEPEILDDRKPDESARIQELQMNDYSQGLIQKDARFHGEMNSAPSTHIYTYRCCKQLNEKDEKDKELLDKIIKDGKEADSSNLRYDFFSDQSGMRGNHWVITIAVPMCKDLKYSNDTRTAGLVYEELNQDTRKNAEGSALMFKPLFGNIYPTSALEKPLTFAAIKEKIKKHGKMYLNDGRRVPENFFNEFHILLFAYDEKLRAEQKLMQRIFIEYDSEPDYNYDGSEGIVNRSEIMISALKYIYILLGKKDRDSLKKILGSFASFYTYLNSEALFEIGKLKKSFSGVSELLAECGFMEINPKSILDLLLIYNAYRYMMSLLYS